MQTTEPVQLSVSPPEEDEAMALKARTESQSSKHIYEQVPQFQSLDSAPVIIIWPDAPLPPPPPGK